MMMTRWRGMAGTAALLLAACNGGGDGHGAASDQAAVERGNLSLAEATDLVGRRFPLRAGL